MSEKPNTEMIAIPISLLLALVAVESGGNDHARTIARDGKPRWGCLQISAAVIDDVNHATKYAHGFTPADALNREKSFQIARLYLGIYATEKRIGHPVTIQDMAAIWHRGPRGYKQPSPEYWRRVAALMAKAEALHPDGLATAGRIGR